MRNEEWVSASTDWGLLLLNMLTALGRGVDATSQTGGLWNVNKHACVEDLLEKKIIFPCFSGT